MIKVMWFLKRAEHLSLEEFSRWRPRQESEGRGKLTGSRVGHQPGALRLREGMAGFGLGGVLSFLFLKTLASARTDTSDERKQCLGDKIRLIVSGKVRSTMHDHDLCVRPYLLCTRKKRPQEIVVRAHQ